MEQLRAAAAAVLMRNPSKGRLECVHGKGIQSIDFYKTSVRLDNCTKDLFSNRNRLKDISKVFKCQEKCERAWFFTERGFASFHGVPLVVQGEIIGVIEILHHQSLTLDSERNSFLEIVAAKISNAIADTELFRDLLGHHTPLPLPNQDGLESLTHALNLQDKETEIHALQTAKMAALLAQSMGMNQHNLGSVKRGALLHDIGKMGIPEVIINKPGPLSGNEWNIMRKHPVYAYHLINPIPSLKDSIEIPYCHHEKWDGTGYPQGIRGEQIPVSARIFAVIDVWDALRSNRPYRSAWTDNQARNYISQQSGKHFDPRVVDKFFELELDKTY
jgi:putative nucleotidyltransferase with HDIG domain